MIGRNLLHGQQVMVLMLRMVALVEVSILQLLIGARGSSQVQKTSLQSMIHYHSRVNDVFWKLAVAQGIQDRIICIVSLTVHLEYKAAHKLVQTHVIMIKVRKMQKSAIRITIISLLQIHHNFLMHIILSNLKKHINTCLYRQRHLFSNKNFLMWNQAISHIVFSSQEITYYLIVNLRCTKQAYNYFKLVYMHKGLLNLMYYIVQISVPILTEMK